MKKVSKKYVGCDLGDRFSEIAVIDEGGAVIETARIRTNKRALEKQFSKYTAARVVIEVGVHSRWVSELLERLGHEVVLANPRQVKLISRRRKKTDRSDALLLARLGRADPTLLAPVRHRSNEAQIDLAAIRSRDILVGARTKLMNHLRGTLMQFGIRIPKGSGGPAMARHVGESIPPQLIPALGPVVEALAILNEQVDKHDNQIAELARNVYPEVNRMTQVYGVGELTALTFALTIEDPHRFTKSRFAGPFFGLTPGKDQSGDSDPEKRITKAGDPLVRKLLVQSAHTTLREDGEDSDLRRWGLKLASRGGRNAFKRAVIAVARKLAVLMHRLWLSGKRYQPLGYAAAH